MAGITLEQVKAALAKVCENGESDKRNELDAEWATTCFYTNRDGSPHCVIAHVFVELGIPLPAPRDPGDWTPNVCTINELLRGGVSNDPDYDEILRSQFVEDENERAAIQELLGKAQLRADMDNTWGEAYQRALEVSEVAQCVSAY